MPSEGAASPPREPAAEPALAPERQWVRGDDGRLRRHDFANMSRHEFNRMKAKMSKQERKMYYSSLCADVPPEAARICRKKMKYRKQMGLRRAKGDRLLNSMHFEEVSKDDEIDAIMNSSLSKFITFAANDCGYGGRRRELVCDYVHPLFLKAKSAVSKEDNPNWFQAMNDPVFAKDWWKAAVTEIETLEEKLVNYGKKIEELENRLNQLEKNKN